MLFASALPVFAPQGLQREALGCILAILAVKNFHGLKESNIGVSYLY
jgi:hypothetical protein